MKNTACLVWQEGVARWPQLALSLDDIAQRVPPEATIADVRHPGDLYVACGCASGAPEALRIFEAHFLVQVDAFVTRINRTQSFAEEVKQRLRDRLLVGPSARIRDYHGQGPLGAWLRVAAVHVASDLARQERRPRAEREKDLATRALDPELRAIKGEHHIAIESALREAVARLSPRDRNVLRMHFVNGWSFARVARAYHVHRATAMRWVEDIRQRLLDELSADIGDKLGLNIDQLRSLIGVLRSQVDASLSGLEEASASRSSAQTRSKKRGAVRE